MVTDAIKVLLVEDNPGDFWLIHNYLAESPLEHFALTSAQNLVECFNALNERSFDIILLDLTLPDSTGLDTFKRVHKKALHLPIIILTGLDDTDLAVKGVRAGAQDYLVKNKIDSDLLTRAIRYGIERQRVERALRESESSYRGLIETIHEGFAIVDGDETILFVNLAFCDILGYTQEELVGTKMTSLMPVEEIPKTIQATETKKRGKKPTKYEVVMRRKDGQLRDILVSSSPLLDENGEYRITIGVWMDITDQKRNEYELQLKTAALNEAYHRVNELLQNILPMHVINELESTNNSQPRLVNDATIVFIDIVDFSNISARVDPKAVINKLTNYFNAFDQIVKQYELEKLKTVGDGYMFAGGLFSDSNQLEECADACLDILSFIRQDDWRLRIGMHVGPCIAGLIKGWRMIYDVWGNTVNLAARLEKAGEPSRINVSEEVQKALATKFIFEDRGPIPIHNFSPHNMYFLVERLLG